MSSPRDPERCTGVAGVFFANFFSLLLLMVSLSEWALFWWVFADVLGSRAWIGHLTAPPLFLAVNVALIRSARSRGRPAHRRLVAIRFYQAVAFTSLFGFAFLLLSGTAWLASKLVGEAIAVEALTVRSGASGSGLDDAFRWLTNLGLGGIALAFTYGYTVGQRRLKVTTLALPLRNAGPGLSAFRIVQISDIHIGHNLRTAELRRFVARVNRLAPDLICITGDIVDSPVADLETNLPELAALRATHGVVAILGNHDHYAGADWVRSALRRLTSFTVLCDEAVTITVSGAPLHIIGLDDRGRDWARGWGAVPHLDRALEGIPAHAPILLLSHRPDVFPQAAARGVSLMLAGHTHGGQLGLPWFGGRTRNLAEFITAFDRGLYERDGHYLYVNAGLGVTGQRIRLATPREITVIEILDDTAEQRAA